jgi:hypothetical protein
LIGTSQDLNVSSSDLVIEFKSHLGRRIGYAVNTPAALLAAMLGTYFREHQQAAVDLCTGILLLPQWYLVGLWVDWYVLSARPTFRRYPGMVVSAAAFLAVLIIAMGAWYDALAEPRILRSAMIEVFFSLIAWPTLLLWGFGRLLIELRNLPQASRKLFDPDASRTGSDSVG